MGFRARLVLSAFKVEPTAWFPWTPYKNSAYRRPRMHLNLVARLVGKFRLSPVLALTSFMERCLTISEMTPWTRTIGLPTTPVCVNQKNDRMTLGGPSAVLF